MPRWESVKDQDGLGRGRSGLEVVGAVQGPGQAVAAQEATVACWRGHPGGRLPHLGLWRGPNHKIVDRTTLLD
jgi:hypothetical protein